MLSAFFSDFVCLLFGSQLPLLPAFVPATRLKPGQHACPPPPLDFFAELFLEEDFFAEAFLLAAFELAVLLELLLAAFFAAVFVAAVFFAAFLVAMRV